jgi:hypothetical protein
MIQYYQENTGDFLAIDTATNSYYLRNFGKDHFEGRASAITNQVGSVCTTAVSRQYLQQNCKRIARARVPMEWRKAIGLENCHV